MNLLQYMCVDMHGRAPLGLTPPSDPSDGCGAVADGRPFLPSELYVGLDGLKFFSHINITSVFKLVFVSNPAHSIDKIDSCKVIRDRDIYRYSGTL